MSTIKVNTVTKRTGSTLTLGESGTTVTLACGATQSGFGRTGTVDWCTTAKTAPFTSVSGKGYFVNTSGGTVTVTLPASPSAGDIVSIKDYKDTFNTNNVTVGRNSSKIGGQCLDATLSTQGDSITLIYVDGTQGWVNIQTDDTVAGQAFVAATGGTVLTCGDFKTHVFTATGCFQVTSAGNPLGSNTVSYLVVAGGGGAGYYYGAGGAGGYREGKTTDDTYTGSPLAATTGLPVAAQTYPVTVGAGGTAAPGPTGLGGNGANSVFSTITSAGGGGGIGLSPAGAAGSGGSGGSAGYSCNTAGSGNTPPVTPPQGNDGGAAGPTGAGGGGGGATVAGQDAPGANVPGDGGNGANIGTNFFGPTSGSYGTPGPSAGRWFSGGGSAAHCGGTPGTNPGGAGGGGFGKGPLSTWASNNGTANTGGGAGGGGGPYGVGTGGSGFVAIRYKFQ